MKLPLSAHLRYPFSANATATVNNALAARLKGVASETPIDVGAC